MNRRIFALVSFSAFAMVACGSSQSDDPGQPAPPSSNGTAAPQGTIPKASADVGTARRKAQGQNCCYKDEYYKCSNTTACNGGFDLEDCITKCNGDVKCATNTCTPALRHAPPPTSDCVKGAAPSDFQCNLY